jgi:DUF971 family protein
MNPIQIKLVEKKVLYIVWENDTESNIPLKYLRDECPCAGCKGETILLKSYRAPAPQVNTPGRYEIKNIETVGDYAIQITWNDRHNTGIYTWNYLQELDKGQSKNKNQNYEPLI